MIKLIVIILIGKSLLLIADEKDIMVYVKLATLLIFLTVIIDFIQL